MQYVGFTADQFRYRWNNYKDNNRKAEREVEHMKVDLFEHFASQGHNGSLEDCTVTLTDKNDSADLTRKEEYWRRVLKTVFLYGLNTVGKKFYILVRLLYVFPRQGYYQCKMFNSVITIVCKEDPSAEGSYHLETS